MSNLPPIFLNTFDKLGSTYIQQLNLQQPLGCCPAGDQEGEPGEYKRRYLPPERAENQREYPNRGADGLCPQQGLPPAQCPRGVTSLLLTIPYPTGLRRGYHHCPEAAGF